MGLPEEEETISSLKTTSGPVKNMTPIPEIAIITTNNSNQNMRRDFNQYLAQSFIRTVPDLSLVLFQYV
jgi:hypothetical protein